MPGIGRVLKSLALLVLGVVLVVVPWAGWVIGSTRQETVAFQSDGLTLRGTRLSPRFAHRAPGVVMVHGSGETSRKSMMLYAWVFASRGYAVLAYDKRGVGASEGDRLAWRDFSINDLADDAAAGYRLLRATPGIDPARVGFFGASQGGWVVSLAANRVERPAFLILASASVSTIAEDRLYGRAAQVRHAGFKPDAVAQAVDLMRMDQQVTRTGQGFAMLQARWEQDRRAPWFRATELPDTPRALSDPNRLWERTVLDFDPRPQLERLKTPILWIFGDPRLDRFSPVSLSVTRVRAAADAGKPYEIIQINRVGHTLELEGDRTAETTLTVRIPLIFAIFRWLDDRVYAGMVALGAVTRSA